MSIKSSSVIKLVVTMAVFCPASIALLVGGPRVSFAENVLEFAFPEVVEPARQASAKLLDAASTILRAMSQAELGDVEGANGQLREAMSVLDQSEKAFTAVAAQMKDRSIDYAKVPKEIGGVPIERILGQFKITPPKTTGDLAKITLNEVDTLRKAVGDLKFGQKSASRPGVFRVSGALRRALDVGVVISMLADAAA